MAVVFEKTPMLCEKPFHYCPGCTHGIIHRLVAEALTELGIGETAIGVAPVGCAVFAYEYFNCDMFEAAHGRAPAVATGIKRVCPDKAVFTYQGDGDLASIGTAEIVHAATRGEKITTIFVNNAIYGMTGGQMAPTTLPGQVTTTSPYGRDTDHCGYPVRVSEMLGTLNGPAYIERVSVHDVPHIRKAKAAIKKAFQLQMEGRGFTMVEVLSTCPTNWGKTPQESLTWVKEAMMPAYPLGVYKDITAQPATEGGAK
jgi:2-oxoglutarate ferredoxin oxidoreductase subunit beta